MLEFLHKLDLQVLEFIQDYIQNPLNDKIFSFITRIGDSGFIWILIALFFIISKKDRKAGFLTLISLLVAAIFVEHYLKELIQRARPFIDYDFQIIIDAPSSYSFPSGHTTTSFAAAIVLATLAKKYKHYFIGLAILISFSRVYLYVHYPTDIFAGAILGSFCALLVVSISRYLEKNTLNNFK